MEMTRACRTAALANRYLGLLANPFPPEALLLALRET